MDDFGRMVSGSGSVGKETRENSSSYTSSTLCIRTYIKKINSEGKKWFERETRWVIDRAFQTFHYFSINPTRNASPHVVCYDRRRVVLTDPLNETNHYVHASYVDSKTRKGAFILTQLPLPSTIVDFWRMVWQVKAQWIIVLEQTLNVPFWPKQIGPGLFWIENGALRLELVRIVQTADYDCYYIQVCRVYTNASNIDFIEQRQPEFHNLRILQYKIWTSDNDVPRRLSRFAERARIGIEQLGNNDNSSSFQNPPVIIACATGTTRSGTFVALYNCLESVRTNSTLDVHRIVSQIRDQRFGCLNEPAHYLYLHEQIFDFVLSRCQADLPIALDSRELSARLQPHSPDP